MEKFKHVSTLANKYLGEKQGINILEGKKMNQKNRAFQ